MYSPLIRSQVDRGDLPLALNTFNEMISRGIAPRRRTYSALLAGCLNAKDSSLGLAMFDDMMSRRILPSLREYQMVVTLLARNQLHDKVQHILNEMTRQDVAQIDAEFANAVEQYFQGKYHSGTDSWRWRTDVATIDPSTGECPVTGVRLRGIDIDDNQHEQLKQHVEALCLRNGTQGVSVFRHWLAQYGPFDAVLDGANIGFSDGRTLIYSRIEAVARLFERQGKRPIVVLPKRYMSALILSSAQRRLVPQKKVFRMPSSVPKSDEQLEYDAHRNVAAENDTIFAPEIVTRWQKNNMIFTIPPMIQDDFYLLYAALSNRSSQLITNDQMRDHHFSLQHARSFVVWRERHMVPFEFPDSKDDGSPKLSPPPLFSQRIQLNRQGTVWHFPLMGEENANKWLVAWREDR